MTSLLRACSIGVLSSVLAAGAMAQTPDPQQPPPAAPPPSAPLPPDATAADLEQDLEQEPPAEPPPGYIVSVEGAAVLERAGTTSDAITGMPLLVGDRLRSEAGELEIKWAERSTLRLARYTDLDILSTGMVRVPRGRVAVFLVTAPGQSAHDQLAIDAPGASVRFYSAGDYRVNVGGTGEPVVELAVIRGSAQLASDNGQTLLAAGERATASAGDAPSTPEGYTADPNDAAAPESTYDPTDDVAAFKRSSAGGAYQGTSYLPTELYGYESVLAGAGTWRSDPSYGYVWYPHVANDWRPYYRGRWQHLPRYGWTWIGFERWSWPTHHYGRWGVSTSGAWFWKPHRRWGPAWVTWAIAPSYVGWCPLGWNGRPVFAFASFTTHGHRRGHDPWRAWTVIPSQRFGHRFDVHRHRVDRRILVEQRPAFITSVAAPRHRPGRISAAYTQGAPDGIRSFKGSASGAVPNVVEVPARRTGSSSASRSGSAGIGRPPDHGRSAADADGDESPYDRALRVMKRRVDDNRVDGSRSDANRGDGRQGDGRQRDASPSGMSGPGVRSGSAGGATGASPRYGTPSRAPRGDDDRDGRSVGSDDNRSRSRGAGAPSRAPSGMSSPRSRDDGAGTSQPRGDDDGRRSGGAGSVRPSGGNRGDRGDDGDRGGRSRGGAVPRQDSPRQADRPSDGGSRGGREASPSGMSSPRGGSDGGSRSGSAGRSGSSGGSKRNP